MIAVLVGLVAAPDPFGPRTAIRGMAQGAWLATLVAAVILGGLFFREILSSAAVTDHEVTVSANMRRRQLYTACFLVGPFAEAATGYGVGQVAVASGLKRIGLSPANAVVLGLLSQMMVPWGASAICTTVGAELAGLPPSVLGVYSAFLTVPLLMGWLCLFWRLSDTAGIPGGIRTLAAEAATTLTVGGLLIVMNRVLGPEVAAMATLGPLIALRFACESRPRHGRWHSAMRIGLPYAVLIGGVASTRAIAPVNQLLAQVAVRPFDNGPAWFPLLNPGSWLFGVGLLTAAATGRGLTTGGALSRAWARGKVPILATVLFLAMAQVMMVSGMAGKLAEGVRLALGRAAPLATPLLAGLFGFLTGSGNATNGLLMTAQAALARSAHLSVPWLAALQNVAAAALTMLSPIRLAFGCALAGDPDLQSGVYRRAWSLGAIPLLILILVAALIIV